jgi:hypothetical protein
VTLLGSRRATADARAIGASLSRPRLSSRRACFQSPSAAANAVV